MFYVLYYIGEGNGTPLQYSCLENPMDRGAWWAAVHGVTRSRTRLSNSLSLFIFMHWRRQWQPTPVLLPGESLGRGSLVGCRLWGRTESDTTEVTWQRQCIIYSVLYLANFITRCYIISSLFSQQWCTKDYYAIFTDAAGNSKEEFWDSEKLRRMYVKQR